MSIPGMDATDAYAEQSPLFTEGDTEITSKQGIFLTWIYKILMVVVIYMAATSYGSVSGVAELKFKINPNKGELIPSDITDNITPLPADSSHEDDFCLTIDWSLAIDDDLSDGDTGLFSSPYCEDPHLSGLKL